MCVFQDEFEAFEASLAAEAAAECGELSVHDTSVVGEAEDEFEAQLAAVAVANRQGSESFGGNAAMDCSASSVQNASGLAACRAERLPSFILPLSGWSCNAAAGSLGIADLFQRAAEEAEYQQGQDVGADTTGDLQLTTGVGDGNRQNLDSLVSLMPY